MKVIWLGLAILFFIPFGLTLLWWSEYHFQLAGTLPQTAFGMFLILGLPSGLASAVMFWRWRH